MGILQFLLRSWFFLHISQKILSEVSNNLNFKKNYCPEYIIWGERNNEMYGSSVAIWNNMIIVGAYGDESRGSNTGAAYVYYKSDIHHDWEQINVLHPNDGKSDDQYGYSVSLDYHTIVVGANKADIYGEDSGAAYLYNRKQHKGDQEIQYVMKLLPENGSAQDYFGTSVTVYGNITVVGAWGCDAAGTLSGCAYVWTKYFGDKREGEWLYTQQLFPTDGDGYQRFGTSVATYKNFVAIGAPGWMDSNGHEIGAVYLYRYGYDDSQYIGFSWQQIMRLVPSDGLHYDLYGYSVALWDNTLLIGSPQHASVGSGNSISQAGAVYSYAYTLNKKWEFMEKIEAKDPVENGHFGFSLDVYGDMAAIGSYNQEGKGSVSIYLETVDSNTLQHEKWEYHTLRHPKSEIPGDYYGYTVSIYGPYLAVGAYGASLSWENPYASPDKEIYSSGGIYLYYGYSDTHSDTPTRSYLLELGGLDIALIAVGSIAIVLIYLEFRGKLEIKIEGTEYQLTDLESSHRSMAEYALSYFKPKEESTNRLSPITNDPVQLSPFLPKPSPKTKTRVIDSLDSSSNSLASISSHSVDTIHPPNTSTYGPSQQDLDESIRLGVKRNTTLGTKQ